MTIGALKSMIAHCSNSVPYNFSTISNRGCVQKVLRVF